MMFATTKFDKWQSWSDRINKFKSSEGIKWCQALTGERVINWGIWNLRAEWVEKRIFYLTNIQSVFKPQSWQNLSKKKVLLSFKYVNLRVKFSGEVKVCYTFQAQRVMNWGIKNLKSDCFHPIKTFPIVSLDNCSTLFAP